MAKFLYGKYVPKEVSFVKRENRNIEDYKSKGYEVEELPYDLYQVTKPPRLEMFFREGERDFVFDMLKEATSYCCKENKAISPNNVLCGFILDIISGKIKILIFPDGSYTLE